MHTSISAGQENLLWKMIVDGFIDQAEAVVRANPHLNFQYRDAEDHVNLLSAAVSQDATELVAVLLERCPSMINEPSGRGKDFTPLMIAVRGGYDQIVSLLLKQPGIDVYCVSAEGKTAFSYACDLKSPRIIKEFLEHVNIDDLDIKAHMPLHDYEKKAEAFANQVAQEFHNQIDSKYAVCSKIIYDFFDDKKIKSNIKSVLLSYRDRPKAVQAQTCKLIKESYETHRVVIFPEEHAFPIRCFVSFHLRKFEVQSIHFLSSLQEDSAILEKLAAGKPEAFLLKLLENGFVDQVEFFLRDYDEIDLNYTDERTGNGFLLAAIEREEKSLAHFLFWKDPPRINETFGEEGLTPLMFAVKHQRPEIISFLMKQPGIDVYKTSKTGKTALFYAMELGGQRVIQNLLGQSDFFELQRMHEIPYRVYQEKSESFAIQLVQEFQSKLTREYQIFECLVQSVFDWDCVERDIQEALNHFYFNAFAIRNATCELIKTSKDQYQLIIFGKKSQDRFLGAWKEVKIFQFFVEFNLKNFQIHSIELDVSLSHNSRMLQHHEQIQIQNLEKDGFSRYIKLPKRVLKKPRVSYRKKNDGLNLKLFLRHAVRTPFVIDDDMHWMILDAILEKFFLKFSQREALHDIKLDNMAIRVGIEEGQKKVEITLLDTVEQMITPGYIPISFLATFHLDTTDKIIFHELTPFIQIVVSCVVVFLNGRRIYEASQDDITKAISNIRKYLSEKEALYEPGFIVMIEAACLHVLDSGEYRTARPYGNFCLDISRKALCNQIAEYNSRDKK